MPVIKHPILAAVAGLANGGGHHIHDQQHERPIAFGLLHKDR